MKTLLVRVDGIGDLVSTLFCDQHPEFQADETVWLINDGLQFVAEAAAPRRPHLSTSKKFGWAKLLHLVFQLRKEKFDRAFIFHAPWWISLVVFLAGIRWRGGKRSQWHSYLFLPHSSRQSRKSSEHHEAQYNYDLISQSFQHKSEPAPVLKLIAKKDVTLGLPKKFIVVHPGMAGSARNLPIDSYRELIQNSPLPVLITGTAGDTPWIQPLEDLIDGDHVRSLQGQLNGSELLSVLSQAKAVFAPSTGICHLAASLGSPVVTFFSPIKVQAPQRWQPRGPSTRIFQPTVDCPEEFHCALDKCEYYDCMKRISIPQVIRETGLND